MRKCVFLVIFAVFLFANTSQLYASDTNLSGFNLQYFRLTQDGSGSLSVYGSETLGHLKPYLRLDTHVSGSLIKASNPVNNQLVDLVKTLWTTDLSFALGLTDFINVSLQVPFHSFEKGTDDTQNVFKTMSMGDLGFEGKFKLLKESKTSPGIALLMRVTAPTGDNRKFTGQGSPTFEFRSILNKKWSDFYIAANFGYKLIDRHQLRNAITGVPWNIVDDDRLIFGLGAYYVFPWQNKTWSVKGQVIGETVLSSIREVTTPIEFEIGGQKYLGKGFSVELGGGRGLTNAVGSPGYRFYAGVSYDFSFLRKKREELTSETAEFISRTIYFDFNNSTIKSSDYPALRDVGQILAWNPKVKVDVNGYTDSVGSNAYNKNLSKKRAVEVKKFLICFGANEEQIFKNAYGEQKPVASNSTPDGRSENRRVEIKKVK